MEISEKIKYIREFENLNQKEFAKKLEITQSTVSKYEKNERTPDFYTLKNLFEIFKINPNWIFFDIEPIYLEIDEKVSYSSNDVLFQDLKLMIPTEELNKELNSIFLEKIVNHLTTENENKFSPLRKFFKSIKLEAHVPFRPLLFLYYILRYVQDFKEELNNVSSYKNYLLDLVKKYKVASLKNNPAFTSTIKKQFEIAIELNLDENQCKSLLVNYDEVLKKIESKMPAIMNFTHKTIDTKTLFPKA